MKTKYFSLPVEITENKTFSFDDSLIPVDIKVMHNNLNLNGSTFFDEAIEDAKESLKNKPILGYIKKVDGSDDSDFSGHEIEISFGEDGLKVVYLERPLGTVPETNNYSILEENGKKYVFCRGYLWKEYLNSGYEILRNNPKKSVSMEIAVDNYDINDDGSINITKYRYLGITILGDDVPPAMTGAELNVVGQFSKDVNEDFYNKIEQLNYKISQYFAINNSQNDIIEGGESVGEKLEDEVVETTEETFEETTTEGVEETTVDTSEEVTKTEETTEEFSNTNTDKVETEEEKFTKVFELSHDDIRSKLYTLLYKVEEDDDEYYYIQKVYDNYFIYGGWDEDTCYKQGYITTDVDVAFEGERVQIFVEYLTAEELEELNNMRSNYSLILKENEELKEFKAQKDKEEFEAEQEKLREEKIEHINTEYEHISDDIKELFISKVDEYESTEDLDADICVYIVKNKVTFSKAKKENTSVKLEVEQNEQKLVVSPYGDLF